MPEQTNKELLELLLKQTTDNAKNQLSFAGKVSTFINEQRVFNNDQVVFNAEFRGYLESNSKTNQKGLIEQQSINTTNISNLTNIVDTDKKVTSGKIATAGFIFSIIGAIILKAIGLIKFIL